MRFLVVGIHSREFLPGCQDCIFVLGKLQITLIDWKSLLFHKGSRQALKQTTENLGVESVACVRVQSLVVLVGLLVFPSVLYISNKHLHVGT